MSYKEGDKIHIEDDDAMAASTTGHLRWILGISLFVTIAILSAIWIFGAFSFDETPAQSSAPAAVSDDTTLADDAVVTPGNDEVVGE